MAQAKKETRPARRVPQDIGVIEIIHKFSKNIKGDGIMSVMIDYFARYREKATIDALRDYYDQKWKLENDPKRIRELTESITAPQGMSVTPVHGGGSRREERLCEVIDKKAVIENGYRRAVEYHREFEPCWNRLTDDERNILTLRFVDYLDGGGIKRTMDKYNISKTEAYRRSDQALRRLTKLLYW